jgi:hypothetical protein
VWKGKSNETGSVVTCAGQTDVVVQCFLMTMNQKLLSCAQDGSVKVCERCGPSPSGQSNPVLRPGQNYLINVFSLIIL